MQRGLQLLFSAHDTSFYRNNKSLNHDMSLASFASSNFPLEILRFQRSGSSSARDLSIWKYLHWPLLRRVHTLVPFKICFQLSQGCSQLRWDLELRVARSRVNVLVISNIFLCLLSSVAECLSSALFSRGKHWIFHLVCVAPIIFVSDYASTVQSDGTFLLVAPA